MQISRFFLPLMISVLSPVSFASSPRSSGGGLEVIAPYNSIPLLEETSRSCGQQIGDPDHGQPDDQAGFYAPLRKLILKWRGSKPLRVESMKVAFRGDGMGSCGSQEVLITGTELNYLWSGTMEGREIPARSEVSTWEDCTWMVGGLSVDTSESFLGEGVVTVSGSYENARGARVRVSDSDDFSFSYYKMDLPAPSPTPVP